MTRYGRYTHCDICGETLYEGEFVKVVDGENQCEQCYKQTVKDYLYSEYIPNHIQELLEKAEEELEELQ